MHMCSTNSPVILVDCLSVPDSHRSSSRGTSCEGTSSFQQGHESRQWFDRLVRLCQQVEPRSRSRDSGLEESLFRRPRRQKVGPGAGVAARSLDFASLLPPEGSFACALSTRGLCRRFKTCSIVNWGRHAPCKNSLGTKPLCQAELSMKTLGNFGMNCLSLEAGKETIYQSNAELLPIVECT